MRCIVVKYTLTGKRPINPAYPESLITLGDHLRKERLDRGMSQFDVAKIIKVSVECILGWELNRNIPTPKFSKEIISFLGYFPFEVEGISLGKQLFYARLISGKTQKQVAELIHCDSSNLRYIELDQRKPNKNTLDRITKYINHCFE